MSRTNRKPVGRDMMLDLIAGQEEQETKRGSAISGTVAKYDETRGFLRSVVSEALHYDLLVAAVVASGE